MLKNHLIFIALIFLLNHNRNATNQIVSNFARNYNAVYGRTQLCTIVCIDRKGKQKREMMMTENLAKNEIKSIVEWTRIYQLFLLYPSARMFTYMCACVFVSMNGTNLMNIYVMRCCFVFVLVWHMCEIGK